MEKTNKPEELLERATTDRERFDTVYNYAVAHSNTNPKRSLKYADQAIKFATALQDSLLLAGSLRVAGLCLRLTGQPARAYQRYAEALNLYRRHGQRRESVVCCQAIGVIHFSLGNHTEALEAYKIALSEVRQLKEKGLEAAILTNLANTLSSLHRFDDALKHHQRALELKRSIKESDFQIGASLVNIATMHLEIVETYGEVERLKHAHQALEHFEEALDYAKNEPRLELAAWQGIGRANIGLRNFSSARTFLGYVQEEARKLDLINVEADGFASLGEIDQLELKFEQATQHLTKALELYQSIEAQIGVYNMHERLSQVFELRNDPINALQHHKQYAQGKLEATTRNADQRAQMVSSRIALEQAQHDTEIAEVRTVELERLVHHRTKDLEIAHLETLERLATIAEFRDAETAAHVERVGDLSARVASLLGCDPGLVAQLRLAARLHDIGKISIPDAILYSRQKLLPEQWKIIRAHAFIGAQILSGSSSKLLNLAEEIALTHHEHWDGNGYPRGLRGKDIPLVGRIVAVVDVFDALISERAYKTAWTQKDALDEIRSLAGSKFDPDVVGAFLEVIQTMETEQAIMMHHPRAYA